MNVIGNLVNAATHEGSYGLSADETNRGVGVYNGLSRDQSGGMFQKAIAYLEGNNASHSQGALGILRGLMKSKSSSGSGMLNQLEWMTFLSGAKKAMGAGGLASVLVMLEQFLAGRHSTTTTAPAVGTAAPSSGLMSGITSAISGLTGSSSFSHQAQPPVASFSQEAQPGLSTFSQQSQPSMASFSQSPDLAQVGSSGLSSGVGSFGASSGISPIDASSGTSHHLMGSSHHLMGSSGLSGQSLQSSDISSGLSGANLTQGQSLQQAGGQAPQMLFPNAPNASNINQTR